MDSGWKVRSRNLKGPRYANVTSPAVLPEKPHWLRPVSFVYYSKHVVSPTEVDSNSLRVVYWHLQRSLNYLFCIFSWTAFHVENIHCVVNFWTALTHWEYIVYCKIDQLKTSSVLKERWKPRLCHAFFIFRSATISHTLWHLRSTALVEMVHGSRRTDEDGGRPLRWLSE